MNGLRKSMRSLSGLAVIGAVLLLVNCPNPILNQINQRTAQANSGVSPFATFTFTSALNGTSGVTLDVTGTISGSDVTVTVPYGTRVNALVATFTTSSAGTVTIGSTAQTSATTSNDYTNPVTYTLTTTDGTIYSGTVTVTVGPAGVIISSSTLTLAAGGQPTPLYYTISPPDPSATFTWTTSDSTIVKLTSVGLVTTLGQAQPNGGGTALIWEEMVTPLATGTATVTLKTADGSKSASCTITVTPPVYVTGVTLNTSSMSIPLGGSPTYLQATVVPSNATNQFVTWTSSTPGVATVDAGGTVTAVSLGYTVVTATTFDGSKTATCLVTVVAPTSVTGITMNNPSASIATTQTNSTYITATLAPANATNQHVTWSSDTPSVATVTNYGGTYAYVTPVAVGTATITAKTQDGNFTATCAVTVTAPVAVTGVTMSQQTLALSSGSTNYLYAYVSPTNATNANVTWSTDNASVASVISSYTYQGSYSDGTYYAYGYANVKAVGAGTATLTAKTTDGNKTATCTVTVTAPILVNSVVLNAATIARNSTYTMNPTVYPFNATNKYLNWSSNGPSVAGATATYTSGTNYGTITGVGVGSTTIAATSTDGSNKSGTATITVSAITSVSIGTNLTLSVTGTTYSRDATISPTLTPTFTNSSDIDLTWTSDAPSVATATPSGNFNYGYIYGYSVGTAHITGTATDGSGQFATITVTVNP